MILFPTDLASFLELIRQHGDAAYSFVFAFAASHSLLMTLFAGYAASSGVFASAPLIAVCWVGSFCGDVIRFWIGRRFGHPVRALSAARSCGAGRRSARGPSLRLDDPVPPLSAWHPRRRGLRLRHVAAAVADVPGAEFHRGRPVGLHHRADRLRLRALSEKVMNDASSGFGIVMLVRSSACPGC